MQSVLFHVKGFVLNVITFFLNLFIRRDKNIWIFGSWMGTRFADNSRYLYQFMHMEHEKFGIHKVIWITRNRSVYEMLKQYGYMVEMSNSAKGIYYHIKAGVHVVCNMAYTNGKYLGDINGNLSNGAIKIQLWHGFPIKSSVHQSHSGNKKILSKIHSMKIYKYSLPGKWLEEQFVASLSSDCTRRYRIWFDNENLKTIECGYPRDCQCVKYMRDELDVLRKLDKYSKTILYLPTFRSYPINFKHPLTNTKLAEWIVKQNILWIEKPHLASSMTDFFAEIDLACPSNLMRLDNDFDVNVLIPKVSIVVTDYSSVSVDAIYFNCPVVYYVPDYDLYCKSDRGLTDGFENVTVGPKVYDECDMLPAIEEQIKKTSYQLKKESAYCQKVFFDDNKFSYEQQIKNILDIIK